MVRSPDFVVVILSMDREGGGGNFFSLVLSPVTEDDHIHFNLVGI